MYRMKNAIAAFATDDGTYFVGRHFGDAEFYDLYEISMSEAKFLKRIDNTTDDDEDEGKHGDPKKAKGITGILKEEGVTIAVSKVFGPNLKRIKRKFLCIIFREGSINESIGKLQENFSALADEWAKGEERDSIRL